MADETTPPEDDTPEIPEPPEPEPQEEPEPEPEPEVEPEIVPEVAPELEPVAAAQALGVEPQAAQVGVATLAAGNGAQVTPFSSVTGTGTPPTSPNCGAPRFSAGDPAYYPTQTNAITDTFDAGAI